MANVDEAYCAEADMRTGDLRPPSYQSKEQYIKGAAEEIDIALGHVYVTPFEIENTAVNQPTIKFLKKVNWLLASGRFILDVAAAGEQDNLHAYGKRMLDEATMMLADILKSKDGMVGADKLPEDEALSKQTGPMIHNEDSASLVEGFYVRHRTPFGYPGESWPVPITPVTPYG